MTLPRSSRLAVLHAAALLLVVAAVPAEAQTRDAGRVSVGAAAGVADPLHGDLGFTAASWQADVRVDTARHLAFTVFLEEWRHTEEDVRTDQALTGPGLIGRADRVTLRTEWVTRAAGWTLLGGGRAGRVRVTGGGGVSYLLFSREFSQTMSGCVPASLCRDSGNTFENGSFAAQVQAGVDVFLAPRLAAMGQFRLVVPFRDPGGGHHAVVAGARFVF